MAVYYTGLMYICELSPSIWTRRLVARFFRERIHYFPLIIRKRRKVASKVHITLRGGLYPEEYCKNFKLIDLRRFLSSISAGLSLSQSKLSWRRLLTGSEMISKIINTNFRTDIIQQFRVCHITIAKVVKKAFDQWREIFLYIYWQTAMHWNATWSWLNVDKCTRHSLVLNLPRFFFQNGGHVWGTRSPHRWIFGVSRMSSGEKGIPECFNKRWTSKPIKGSSFHGKQTRGCFAIQS